MPKLLRRITSSGQFLPYIDGLRFLSLFMILMFHFYDYYRDRVYSVSPELNEKVIKFTTSGFSAVMLFFGISGFILGLPFLNQYAYGGKKVKIKDYLFRRLTRLEPPYIIVLTSLFILSLVVGTKGGFQELLPHYLASLFYSHNAIYDGFPVLSDVLWSLEIEVQFYLIAPFLALIFKLNKTTRRILLLILIFIYTDYIRSYIDPFAFKSIFKYVEYFLAGFLAADLFLDYKDKVKQSYFFDIICIYFILSVWLVFNDFPISVKIFAIIAATPFSIIWRKILSLKFLIIIGGMCYTIYMLHQRLLYLVLGNFYPNQIIADTVWVDVTIRVVIYVVALGAVSSVFYIFIERPTMKREWWKYKSLKKLFFE